MLQKICNFFTKPTTFFQQYLRYSGEIDMEYHAWMEYYFLRISGIWNERLEF